MFLRRHNRFVHGLLVVSLDCRPIDGFFFSLTCTHPKIERTSPKVQGRKYKFKTKGTSPGPKLQVQYQNYAVQDQRNKSNTNIISIVEGSVRAPKVLSKRSSVFERTSKGTQVCLKQYALMKVGSEVSK